MLGTIRTRVPPKQLNKQEATQRVGRLKRRGVPGRRANAIGELKLIGAYLRNGCNTAGEGVIYTASGLPECRQETLNTLTLPARECRFVSIHPCACFSFLSLPPRPYLCSSSVLLLRIFCPAPYALCLLPSPFNRNRQGLYCVYRMYRMYSMYRM